MQLAMLRNNTQPSSVDELIHPGLSVQWHLGTQRRRVATMGLIALLASFICVPLIARFEVMPLVTLVTWLALIVVAWRPRVGLYAAFGLVLLFETNTRDELMLPGYYLFGTGVGTGFRISGTMLTPLEILLLLMFGSWVAHGVARRQFDFRAGRLGWPMLLFVLALVAGLAWGILSGGDSYVAFWEARALFYLVICYLIAANTIRTRQHVQTLTTITFVCTALFAVEGAYRYLALIQTGVLAVAQEFAYEHDTVIFLVALVLLIVAQQAFGAPRWQRVLALPVIGVTMLTLLATQRRAGYIALIVAFLALALVLLFAHRKAFFLMVVPTLVIGAVYLPLFWNATGLLGQPARAVRSLSEPDPRDASSNAYREIEKNNLIVTIQSDPVLGVGFGQPFEFVQPLPDLSWWPFWHFEPHHNILWVWLKTGVAGFAVFWALMCTAIAEAARCARRLVTPDLRSFAMLTLAGLIATLVFSYVDLGLTSGRVTVLLGSLLGALSVLPRIDHQRPVGSE